MVQPLAQFALAKLVDAQDGDIPANADVCCDSRFGWRYDARSETGRGGEHSELESDPAFVLVGPIPGVSFVTIIPVDKIWIFVIQSRLSFELRSTLLFLWRFWCLCLILSRICVGQRAARRHSKGGLRDASSHLLQVAILDKALYMICLAGHGAPQAERGKTASGSPFGFDGFVTIR
jgi:hypothetical protein